MKRLILLAVVLSVGMSLAGWRGRFDEQFAAASSTARLPAEYQAVEYLESTGTQYIDTGVSPNLISTHAVVSHTPTGFNNYLYGCRAYTNGVDGAYSMFGVYVTYKDLYQPIIGFNGNFNYTIYPPNVGIKKTTEFLNGSIIVDGDSMGTYSGPDYNLARSCYLFGQHSQKGIFLAGKCKIYLCTISTSSVPQRDLVPAVRKSDSVAGMYDHVSKQFITNHGTGEFIVGPNIED